jgi:MFS family permease
LGLTEAQYQTGLSILFVGTSRPQTSPMTSLILTQRKKKGYIIAQVPSNILLNYIGRPSLYLGAATVCWGLVSTLTSQVRSYRGIVAARFFLGIVEAPFFPGALFYLSKWYTKEEMAKRNAIFFAGSLVSGAFGSLIAAGILSGLSGSLGMAAWQWYVEPYTHAAPGELLRTVGLITDHRATGST